MLEVLELRAALLILLGIYGYLCNIELLRGYNIDLTSVFDHDRNSNAAQVASQVRRIALMATFVWIFCWALIEFQLRSFVYHGHLLSWCPFLSMLYLLGKEPALRRIYKRIVIGGLSQTQRFGDILFSDVLVSYASLHTDIALACVQSYFNLPLGLVQRGLGGPMVLAVASSPLAARIKQCYIDWYRSREKIHLANLLKYLVNNAPYALKLQTTIYPGYAYLLPWTLLGSSLYGLYWDLFVDWNLRRESEFRFPKYVYLIAAISDSILRFSWLIGGTSEMRIFSLQLAELFRRWIWVIFRTENELQKPHNRAKLPL